MFQRSQCGEKDVFRRKMNEVHTRCIGWTPHPEGRTSKPTNLRRLFTINYELHTSQRNFWDAFVSNTIFLRWIFPRGLSLASYRPRSRARRCGAARAKRKQSEAGTNISPWHIARSYNRFHFCPNHPKLIRKTHLGVPLILAGKRGVRLQKYSPPAAEL